MSQQTGKRHFSIMPPFYTACVSLLSCHCLSTQLIWGHLQCHKFPKAPENLSSDFIIACNACELWRAHACTAPKREKQQVTNEEPGPISTSLLATASCTRKTHQVGNEGCLPDREPSESSSGVMTGASLRKHPTSLHYVRDKEDEKGPVWARQTQP